MGEVCWVNVTSLCEVQCGLLLAPKTKTWQKIVINDDHLYLTMNSRWVVLVFNIQIGVIVGESLHIELLSPFLGGIAVNSLVKWVRIPLIHL